MPRRSNSLDSAELISGKEDNVKHSFGREISHKVRAEEQKSDTSETKSQFSEEKTGKLIASNVVADQQKEVGNSAKLTHYAPFREEERRLQDECLVHERRLKLLEAETSIAVVAALLATFALDVLPQVDWEDDGTCEYFLFLTTVHVFIVILVACVSFYQMIFSTVLLWMGMKILHPREKINNSQIINDFDSLWDNTSVMRGRGRDLFIAITPFYLLAQAVNPNCFCKAGWEYMFGLGTVTLIGCLPLFWLVKLYFGVTFACPCVCKEHQEQSSMSDDSSGAFVKDPTVTIKPASKLEQVESKKHPLEVKSGKDPWLEMEVVQRDEYKAQTSRHPRQKSVFEPERKHKDRRFEGSMAFSQGIKLVRSRSARSIPKSQNKKSQNKIKTTKPIRALEALDLPNMLPKKIQAFRSKHVPKRKRRNSLGHVDKNTMNLLEKQLNWRAMSDLCEGLLDLDTLSKNDDATKMFRVYVHLEQAFEHVEAEKFYEDVKARMEKVLGYKPTRGDLKDVANGAGTIEQRQNMSKELKEAINLFNKK